MNKSELTELIDKVTELYLSDETNNNAHPFLNEVCVSEMYRELVSIRNLTPVYVDRMDELLLKAAEGGNGYACSIIPVHKALPNLRELYQVAIDQGYCDVYSKLHLLDNRYSDHESTNNLIKGCVAGSWICMKELVILDFKRGRDYVPTWNLPGYVPGELSNLPPVADRLVYMATMGNYRLIDKLDKFELKAIKDISGITSKRDIQDLSFYGGSQGNLPSRLSRNLNQCLDTYHYDELEMIGLRNEIKKISLDLERKNRQMFNLHDITQEISVEDNSKFIILRNEMNTQVLSGSAERLLMGTIHFRGLGTRVDYDAAICNYVRAAVSGSIPAIRNLIALDHGNKKINEAWAEYAYSIAPDGYFEDPKLRVQ